MDRFAAILLTSLICFVALGQFVQVITRYVLQIPVMGLEETMLYPTIWLYIFGAINGLYARYARAPVGDPLSHFERLSSSL